MNHTRYLNKAAAVATAAAIAASSATVSFATPLGAGQLAIKDAATTEITEVGWKGRRNTAIALGALGAIALGAGLAHTYPHPHPRPYPYAYAPAQCWVQTGPWRGQGYYTYC